jgi:hypothetical protein
VPPVLSSKDRLIKEPKDFTCCEEVGLRIFSILLISFNVLILDRYRRSSRKVVLNLSLIVQYKKKCASNSDIENSSREQFYGSFKKDFGLENDLVRLNEKTRIWITKLRASNLRIPIETGRWYNIPTDERVCTLC